MNGPSYFEIQADDMKRAVKFYGDIFGWTFKEVPGMPVEYWRIHTGGPGGGLLKRPAPRPPQQTGTNAYVCSMQVENFDIAAMKIAGAGGTVALPKFEVTGVCYQGYFLDTEGNTFGIFEPISA